MRFRRICASAAFASSGTTIIYAFMQATGLVNDHLVACPRWAACRDANAT
jgi:DNA-3-methyladenine glycosylase I